MKDGVIILNFARDLLCDEKAVIEGIKKGKIVVLPVENLSMMREINLVYSRDFDHPELLRVSGGRPEESLLHQILAESGQDVLHVNHVEILHKLGVDTDVLRTFIDEWIKSLPPKDPNS